jgi:hypothetical protein
VIGLVVLCLYRVALHTATGVVAVGVAAHLQGEKLGRVDLAAARMFAAFALFQLLTQLRVPSAYSVISVGVPWLLALAAYWGAVLILFRKDRAGATVIALAHFVLWVLLNAGMSLAVAVGAGIAGLPAAKP